MPYQKPIIARTTRLSRLLSGSDTHEARYEEGVLTLLDRRGFHRPLFPTHRQASAPGEAPKNPDEDAETAGIPNQQTDLEGDAETAGVTGRQTDLETDQLLRLTQQDSDLAQLPRRDVAAAWNQPGATPPSAKRRDDVVR